jgi:hypothetical protein
MHARTPPGLTAWIGWCAACATTGWLLAATGGLRGLAWLPPLALVVATFYRWRRRPPAPLIPRRKLRARCRRFRRPLPLVFAALAGLSLLGGSLHAPGNYDALTYRLPRLLHWLAEGHWHWITTPNLRMNLSAANSEWLLAPWLALFPSDRPLFLVNWIAYLFLPGLVFSVFRLAGVSGRAAWFWMWLLPAGYGYVLQSASLGNDLTGAVWALAAIHYALRARATNDPSALLPALLSAALLSGGKVTNLPLLLPCALAWLTAQRLLPALWRARPAATLATALLAAVVSFAPTAFLNHHHTGHWSGDRGDEFAVQAGSPVVALTGNALQAVVRNAEPPVLPGARRTETVFHQLLTPGGLAWIRVGFPRFSVRLGELPQEESSALGLGVSALLALAGASALGRVNRWRDCGRAPGFWIGAGAWISAAVFLAQVAVEATPRLLLPYYAPLALPVVLLASGDLFRRRWARRLAVAAAASALIGLVLTPARPLWPAKTVTGKTSGEGARARLRAVYQTYAQRNDALAPLRRHLPASVTVVGFIGGEDDTEYALWRPFGARRVVHLFDGKRIETRRPPVEWVVVKEEVWGRFANAPFEQWLAANGGERVAEETIVSKVSAGPERWWVARFALGAGAR